MRAAWMLAWLFLLAVPANASEEAWALLRQPGHLVLMRHANAPGIVEEPPGIDLRNCALQRKLDDAGRTQARRVGEAFRRRGIVKVRLFSSQFCRCLETARLLGLGPVSELNILNYLTFSEPAQLQMEAEKFTAYLKTAPARPLAVFVTHVSNIKAVTGITPDSGELVVVKFDAAGKLAVVGRIPPSN
jgi:phosphohistidine phosphatase SixA